MRRTYPVELVRNPRLETLIPDGTAYSHPKGFYDITEGSNFTPSSACGYLCTAGPGYDGPTGMGTPNGTAGF
jgi:hypothetical protein